MFTTWMTCSVDQFEHAVTDEQFAAGRHRGMYRAVCGHLVAPQPMVSPPGRRCRGCLNRVVGTSRRAQPDRRRWTRWLRRSAW